MMCVFTTVATNKTFLILSLSFIAITFLNCNLSSAYFFAVTCPSATPSVLSFIKRIFAVANIILKSSKRLGSEIYIRSIRSLS